MPLPKVVIPNPELLPAGLKPGVIDVAVDLGTAAASFSLSQVLPKGAWLAGIATKIPFTISATTAVKIGVGRLTATADPDKYWLSSGLTAQDFNGKALTEVPVTADETLAVFACDTNGAAAGTIGGTDQYIRLRLSYIQALAI